MANRGDVISVDKLWDIFDKEREKAWEGVDAPIGSQEWEAAAGKIDTINNICEAVHGMNTCSRADGEKAKKPVWRVKQSVVHTDYADGSADTRTIKRASWCCPVCDWFVGEQVEVFGRKHNQQKKNFCDRCGQMIDWESVEKEGTVMTLEEAIKLLKQYQGYDPMFPDGKTLKHAFDLTDETVDTLLTALRPVSREQVEKVWRGEWNQDEHGRVVCSRCGSICAIGTKNALHNAKKYDRFCFYCGAPMTDEAVEMVIKRLEALYGETD